jgi:hypothetical protein
MFEEPTGPKAGGINQLWIIFAVVFVVVVGGAVLYVLQQSSGETTPSTTADLAAADASRDLKLSRASLGKDVTGTRALWSLRIQNNSPYTYTNIGYEARYFGPQDNLLASSEGTIEGSVGPHEERAFSDVQDILYPEGTARYEFRLKEATPSAE